MMTKSIVGPLEVALQLMVRGTRKGTSVKRLYKARIKGVLELVISTLQPRELRP